jgi:hypothetical protein
MPELIVPAYLCKKKLKTPEANSSSVFICRIKYFQVKQVGSGQNRLPDLTRPDKNFQFGSEQLPDPTRPMRSSTHDNDDVI